MNKMAEKMKKLGAKATKCMPAQVEALAGETEDEAFTAESSDSLKGALVGAGKGSSKESASAKRKAKAATKGSAESETDSGLFT